MSKGTRTWLCVTENINYFIFVKLTLMLMRKYAFIIYKAFPNACSNMH